MAELTARQKLVAEQIKPVLKTAPWILRVSEQKKITGPVLVVCERRATDEGSHRLYECGRIYGGSLRACRVPMRCIIREVLDSGGRPLNLDELLDDRLAFRGQIPLDEMAGTKLALLFKLQSKVHSPERVELMAWRIERFSREETMYWLSKASIESLYGRRGVEWAKSGLRLMLAGQQKDIAQIRQMLDMLRKEAR